MAAPAFDKDGDCKRGWQCRACSRIFHNPFWADLKQDWVCRCGSEDEPIPVILELHIEHRDGWFNSVRYRWTVKQISRWAEPQGSDTLTQNRGNAERST